MCRYVSTFPCERVSTVGKFKAKKEKVRPYIPTEGKKKRASKPAYKMSSAYQIPAEDEVVDVRLRLDLQGHVNVLQELLVGHKPLPQTGEISDAIEFWKLTRFLTHILEVFMLGLRSTELSE